MPTEEKTQLVAQGWDWEVRKKRTIAAVDANGNPICAGDFLMCIVDSHSWLKKSEIVKASRAQTSGTPGVLSIGYQDGRGAQSAIHSDQCVVANSPKVEIQFNLQFVLHRLARVQDSLARFEADKTFLLSEVARLNADLVSLPISNG